MKVHQVSETEFVTKGQGTHTAFVDLIALLKEKDDVEVVINNEGYGDILHAHTYGPYFFWKGLRYKGKKIFTVHVIPDSIKGSLPMWEKLMNATKWYFRKVYSYADLLIAISPMVEEAILSLGVKTPIRRIYNPIRTSYWRRTPELRAAGRKRLGLSEHDFVVLGVGQIQGRKGVEDFMEVAGNIPSAKFVWAGGRPFGVFTEGISRIDGQIEENTTKVQFSGLLELDQMPEIYASADVFLFPSYQENCPLAPLEAAASGMPVVFRDIPEYESLYENPYLKAGNNHDFTNLILKLMVDKDFYEQGLKISKTLISQFDQEKIRSQIMEIYYEVSGEKPKEIPTQTECV
jgi:1,2-diacylglycerol-3-alpha-glucose alpha-1,2-galactosyltransferase